MYRRIFVKTRIVNIIIRIQTQRVAGTIPTMKRTPARGNKTNEESTNNISRSYLRLCLIKDLYIFIYTVNIHCWTE